MSGGFVKLYSSVVTSSVWAESPTTKLTWLTLLIIADADGRIEGSIPGIAQLIGISVADFEAALTVFLAPDRYSRTRTDDGRRLREIDGGWEVVNHRTYRDKRSKKQEYDARWVAAKRAERGDRQRRPAETDTTDTHDLSGVSNVEVRGQRSEEGSRSSSSAVDPDLHAPFDATEVAPTGKASAEPDGSARTRAAVAEVFGCWQTVHGKQRSKLESKRTARIKARLAEGFTVEQLCNAIRGAKKDPFLMGKDPRAGRAYDGLETLLRDAAQVERLITLEEGEATGVRAEPPRASAPHRHQSPVARGRSVAEAMRHFP